MFVQPVIKIKSWILVFRKHVESASCWERKKKVYIYTVFFNYCWAKESGSYPSLGSTSNNKNPNNSEAEITENINFFVMFTWRWWHTCALRYLCPRMISMGKNVQINRVVLWILTRSVSSDYSIIACCSVSNASYLWAMSTTSC